MSKSTRDWLLDAEGSLRPPLDACPLKRNWAAAEVPQVRDVLASGYGPGYGVGDAISIVFEQPTAAGPAPEDARDPGVTSAAADGPAVHRGGGAAVESCRCACASAAALASWPLAA